MGVSRFTLYAFCYLGLAAVPVGRLWESKAAPFGRVLARWARYDLIALDEVGYGSFHRKGLH